MTNNRGERCFKPMPEKNADVESLPSNWGRWGPDDERGTLNHITGEACARGARTVRTGHSVSLAMPVDPVLLAGGGPVPAGPVMMPTPVQQMMNYNPAPPAYTDILIVNTHHVAMTHIDAFVHIPVDGEIYPGVPVAEAVSGGRAHRGTTSAFAGGITTRGVFLDLAPGDRVEPGRLVTAGDFDAAELRAGVRVEPGDALVVRYGWVLHRDFREPLPGPSLDVVGWLDERQVSLYLSDVVDRAPIDDSPLPMHEVALARLGMPIIDVAEVEGLARACAEQDRSEFLFALGPMPVLGATGVPVNPLAIF